MKRTGIIWFRVGNQRRALVHGNKLLGSIKADKHLVQRGGYWTEHILKLSSIIYFLGHQNIHILPRDRPKKKKTQFRVFKSLGLMKETGKQNAMNLLHDKMQNLLHPYLQNVKACYSTVTKRLCYKQLILEQKTGQPGTAYSVQ